MLDTLVLDATPLLTLTATQLKSYAKHFYTTPGVHSELKDENVKSQLILWGDQLVVRQPKQAYVDLVWAFARKSGDNQVLSINDVHIIALAAEVHDELTKDSLDRLRKFPGEVRELDEIRKKAYLEKKKKELESNPDKQYKKKEEEILGPQFDDDGFEIVAKKKNKKNTKAPKVNSVSSASSEAKPEEVEDSTTPENDGEGDSTLGQEYSPEDDDGEWITQDNLQEMVVKHNDNVESELNNEVSSTVPTLSAIATGDYACQNVSLQMGIHLLNALNGKQIRRVRNYMLRCHACFEMLPLPKDGTAKQFCPSCGGATLRRIPVSVNAETGKVTPHLSKNFQWITRGNVYSTPNPLSKRYQKKYGNKGYNHVTGSMETDFYAEDQKEYQQAVKAAKWQMKKHEKDMMDYVSGGSADNVITPFTSGGRTIKVKVGRGKYANMSKRN